MKWATAGSATLPSTSEQIVMPNWEPASMMERCSVACRTFLAAGLPWAIRDSMRSRREEIRQNSLATKNALAKSRPAIMATVVTMFTGTPPLPRRRPA